MLATTQRYLHPEADTGGVDKAKEDFIDIEGTDVPLKDVVELYKKSGNLDKDYTTKMQKLSQEREDVRPLAEFMQLIQDDPNEARAQLESLLPGGTGGKDDEDDDGQALQTRLLERVADLELQTALERLRKDADFAENEGEVLALAAKRGIPDVSLSFLVWKGENFEKLHERRVKGAKEGERINIKKASGGDPGRPGAPIVGKPGESLVDVIRRRIDAQEIS